MFPYRLERACILSGTTLALCVVVLLPMAVAARTEVQVFTLAALIPLGGAVAFVAPCAIARGVEWLREGLARRA